MPFDALCIIGVGLIGGSMAQAARRAWPNLRILGAAPPADQEQIRRVCPGLNLVTEWQAAVEALTPASQERALVVLATPPRAAVELLPRIAASTQAVLSDVCSVKLPIVEAARSIALPQRFVGAHPMAGSQASGAGAASADLFRGRPVVLTPTATSDASAVSLLREFWTGLGARVRMLEAAAHDRAVARASHAVHVLAALAAGLVEDDEQAQALASTGYGDTTRVAAGDPALWAEILLYNADQVLPALDGTTARLDELRRALVERDGAALRDLLAAAQRARQAWDRLDRQQR